MIVITSLLMIQPIAAETFRVHDAKKLTVSSYGEKTSVTAGINDAVIIELPEDMTYVQGIELNFKVPKDVAEWRDCVAWSFYTNLTPEPSDTNIDYSGSRSTTGTFSTSLSLNMQIPVIKNNSIKKSPYSYYVEDIPEITGNRIFLRLQLVMKGTPDSLMDSTFEITARPLLINKGKLSITARAEDGSEIKPYTLYIDKNATENSSDGIFLDTGVHDISIVSDYYRNELRTVSIDQAKSTKIEVVLRDITPLVRINSPDNARIFMDDQELKGNDFTQYFAVTEGNHTFRFIIGDYEIVKAIEAVNGRSYTVSVSVEATVSQDE